MIKFLDGVLIICVSLNAGLCAMSLYLFDFWSALLHGIVAAGGYWALKN